MQLLAGHAPRLSQGALSDEHGVPEADGTQGGAVVVGPQGMKTLAPSVIIPRYPLRLRDFLILERGFKHHSAPDFLPGRLRRWIFVAAGFGEGVAALARDADSDQ